MGNASTLQPNEHQGDDFPQIVHGGLHLGVLLDDDGHSIRAFTFSRRQSSCVRVLPLAA